MKYVASILIALLVSQPVFAAPTTQPVKVEYERYRLPKGEPQTIKKERVWTYTLEEMKIILQMDVDLRTAEYKELEYIKLQANQSLVNAGLRKQLEFRDKQLTISQEDRKRLFEKWAEENKKRHLAENKPMISSWIAWSSAAAAVAVAAVLGGILIYKER